MSPRPTLYIAGPLTGPDASANVKAALAAAEHAVGAGWAPFVPHLYHWWDLCHPHDYEHWMALDFVWLSRCDALLRIPGESPGADREVFEAQARRMPVYRGLEALPPASSFRLPSSRLDAVLALLIEARAARDRAEARVRELELRCADVGAPRSAAL